MSFLGDVFGFEKFNLGEAWDKIKEDPERVPLGALDEFSSKAWGKVTGKDYEPVVDRWGSPTDETYAKAEADGINTGPGKTMHGIARTVAQFYAGRAAGNALGGEGASAPGSTDGVTDAASGGADGASGDASAGSDYADSWKDWVQQGMNAQQGLGGQQGQDKNNGQRAALEARAASIRQQLAALRGQ